MLTVYDTAGNAWPSDTQYGLCYLNGEFANVEYFQEHFPRGSYRTITVVAGVKADLVDIENFDATVEEAIPGLESGLYGAGYASMSTADQVGQAISKPWNLFAADPTGTPHFPAAPRLATVVGCQYAWAALNQTQGRNIDISVALPSFFGIVPPAPQPVPTSSFDTDHMEILMTLASSKTDALNCQIREWWNLYRTDPLTVPALQYLQAGYNGPWAGSIDFVQSCIVDTAKTQGHLKPEFASAV